MISHESAKFSVFGNSCCASACVIIRFAGSIASVPFSVPTKPVSYTHLTQGIAALAAQGGVATLSERSERSPRIADFISDRGKLRRTHDTWSLDYV